MFEFYNLNLVQSRLMNTIIRVNGVYVYVVDVGRNRGRQFYIVDQIGQEQKITMENIAYDNMSIGMLEMSDARILWTSRMAVRRWKVGLNWANYGYRAFDSDGYVMFNRGSFTGALYSIFKMLNGEYTTYSEALKQGRGALSKHYAISAGNRIMRKTTCIGVIQNGVPVIAPKYNYFQQEFEKEICISK